jgi:hypothetical protein
MLTDTQLSEYQKKGYFLVNGGLSRHEMDVLAELGAKYGLVAPKGDAGTMLFFHCDLFHSSSLNLSPWDRRIILISYNGVHNTPQVTKPRRPELLSGRDHSPLKPMIADEFRDGFARCSAM